MTTTNANCYKPPFPPCETDVLSYANFAGFPTNGELDKLYIDNATGKQYSWNGTAYVNDSDDTTIYDRDGILTGNRTMAMAGNDLNLTGGDVNIGTPGTDNSNVRLIGLDLNSPKTHCGNSCPIGITNDGRINLYDIPKGIPFHLGTMTDPLGYQSLGAENINPAVLIPLHNIGTRTWTNPENCMVRIHLLVQSEISIRGPGVDTYSLEPQFIINFNGNIAQNRFIHFSGVRQGGGFTHSHRSDIHTLTRDIPAGGTVTIDFEAGLKHYVSTAGNGTPIEYRLGFNNPILTYYPI